jgi:septum formation protein
MGKLILASRSPRRIEMLKRYFNDIKIIEPKTEEVINDYDKPQTAVMKVAFEKADWVKKYSGESGIIIAADTIVYFGSILGKPKDYAEGFETLRLLSGKTHKVFTGLCIIDAESGKKIIDYEETSVTFKELNDGFIKRYLDTGEYKDKAGSYGIQGYGELLVEKIEGCYNNVKGLPLTKLNNLLEKHFSIVLL